MNEQNKWPLFRLLKVLYYFFFLISFITLVLAIFNKDSFFMTVWLFFIFATELINLAIYYIAYWNLDTLDHSIVKITFLKIKSIYVNWNKFKKSNKINSELPEKYIPTKFKTFGYLLGLLLFFTWFSLLEENVFEWISYFVWGASLVLSCYSHTQVRRRILEGRERYIHEVLPVILIIIINSFTIWILPKGFISENPLFILPFVIYMFMYLNYILNWKAA
jgi:hypothetical protein